MKSTLVLALGALALIFPSCRPESGTGSPSAISPAPRAMGGPMPLAAAKPLAAELRGEGSHAYLVACEPGQAITVEVRQHGTDVVLSGRGPGDRAVAGVDDPFGPFGLDRLYLVAGAGGGCAVEVRAAEPAASRSRYEIALRERRPGLPGDRPRLAAQERFAAARRAEAAATAAGYAKAVDLLESALGLWRASGSPREELLTLNHLGYLSLRTGQTDRAQSALAEALALARRLGTKHGEGLTLSNLGKLDKVRGDDRAALAHHLRALPLVRAAGDRFNEALVLVDIGSAGAFQGRSELALQSLRAARELSRALGSRDLEAAAVHNLASVHQQADEPRQALALYRQALVLDGPADGRGRAATLNQLGVLYRRLGRPDLALDQYRAALRLVRVAGDLQWQARTMQNIATAHEELGDRSGAVSQHGEALALSREVGDRLVEARSLGALARLHLGQGDAARAGQRVEQALRISRELGDPYGVLFASRIKAEIAGVSGQPAVAERAFEEALALSRQLAAPAIEAMVLQGRARLRARQNALEPGLADALAALDRIESVRTRVLGDDLRASYVASVHAAYATAADLLMRLHARQPHRGLAERALEVSERGRARGLVEALAAARLEVRPAASPALTALVERERVLLRRLHAVSALRFRLLRRGAPAARLEPLDRDLRALDSAYQETLAQLRQASPRDAALLAPALLGIGEIQAQLDPGTLLLEYSLGEERSYLWAVTRQRVTAHQLPARSTIEALVRPLYEALRRGQTGPAAFSHRPAEVLGELSRLLLGPLPAADLAAARRLVIVADGVLHYLPFAALPLPAAGADGNALLVSRVAVAQLPAASVLPLLRREPAGRRRIVRMLAVLADPIMDRHDPRVRGAVRRAALNAQGPAGRGSFPRLPYTRSEAGAIARMVDRGEVSLALGFDTNRRFVTTGGLAGHRIVHFATHGLVDDTHPFLSGVVLSLVDPAGREVDGVLRLQDLYNLHLDAELVVLSACSTAIGRELRGEGLISLARGFMHAGSPRVVATLWPADEAATAHLMRSFYSGMLRERLPPAEALRRAQLAVAKEPGWRAPYYWAGFVLQGEWR